jgi:hypothetical protein
MKETPMNSLNARNSLGLTLAFTGILLSASTAAAQDESGWSLNFTPVIVLPKDGYRLGGGADPELKYTLDFGSARVSAGGRVGAYYAKNLFGMTLMPTLRVTVPAGPVDCYASVGMGYGWLPDTGHSDLATMARLGVVVHFTESIAIGVEGTLQSIDGSAFSFPSFGSMFSVDL